MFERKGQVSWPESRISQIGQLPSAQLHLPALLFYFRVPVTRPRDGSLSHLQYDFLHFHFPSSSD